MGEKKGMFSGLFRSGFVQSVFTRVLSISMIVSVLIAGVAFSSFAEELRRTALADNAKQLVEVERTISSRMEEITSIACNIGNDPSFYLKPIDDAPSSGREMSRMLKRYLVGNSFIEHLAYCRAAEPDRLFICSGERSLKEFFSTSFGMDAETAAWVTQQIHQENKTGLHMFGSGANAYFAYTYPLPQLADKPKAHVLMMIPAKKVQPLMETLFINGNGEAAVFGADGGEIYRTGTLGDSIELTDFLKNAATEADYTSPAGEKYVLQKIVSETNRWTYVTILRHSDTLSGLANRQIAFIAIILALLVIAMVVMLATIVAQYKPISNLAAQVAEDKPHDEAGGVIDERSLLSSTIATLRDDSEQKQRYETAFYEAASKAKSAFLSSMSHDIRTPMNAIIGMTAIAREHIGDQAYVDDCLQKVQASSDYLLEIINNVLDTSRIESGRVPIAEEPVMLPALMDSVVSPMTSSAEAKSQTLTLTIGDLRHAAVLGDNIHIVPVFVNILSNAVKFTPEGGRITIDVRQTEDVDPQTDTYIFAFADTGIGMPPEFIEHVFDTFTRASGPVASRTEGTGLGMAIAKNLVGMMGGTVRCESELGHGTTFTVTMRMKFADESAAALLTAAKPHDDRSAPEAIDLTGKRILLVEDNAMNRLIAKRIVSETGAEIVEATNGQEAIDAFESSGVHAFDLILMGIQMPVMNGYEATGMIRSLSRADAPTVPIYAMTANTFDEDVRRVKGAGMNGHIGKPYTPETLYKTLAQTRG